MELFYVPHAILTLANFHLYLSLQQIQALEFSLFSELIQRLTEPE